MNRSEIKRNAKAIVFADGPSNALEFTDEIVTAWLGSRHDEDFDALVTEVRYQADRVAEFLACPPPSH